jgi:hypothetical protein
MSSAGREQEPDFDSGDFPTLSSFPHIRYFSKSILVLKVKVFKLGAVVM